MSRRLLFFTVAAVNLVLIAVAAGLAVAYGLSVAGAIAAVLVGFGAALLTVGLPFGRPRR